MDTDEDDVFMPSEDSDSDYVDTKQKTKKPVAKSTNPPKPRKRKSPSLDDVENVETELSALKKPPVKKRITVPKTKKAPLAESNSMDELDDEPVRTKNTSGKSIEEIYQKKTQLEHILLRPDTYIGSIEGQPGQMWVLEETKFVYKQILYVPGLYKIFDEILVNAADNKARDPSMDTMKVTIDREKNEVSIYNNGKGIPIEMHAVEGVYVPELIFGHLLTSSNYDDTEKKVTGGRNGFGAKLCNIFSKKFVVETGDSETKKKYSQTFSNNMSKKTEPKITAHKGESFTKITFIPDLEKFGMTSLDNDIDALFRKRAYDVAGCVPGLKVYLDDVRIKIKSFKEYVDLFIPEPTNPGEKKPTIVYEKFNERWEVAFTPAPESQFQQVSFVNSICTSRGGNHVNYVADQICSQLVELAKKKDKKGGGMAIKPHLAKSHMAVFVNCLIENPSFDTQTKECMTLKVSSFGSKCQVGEEFMKKVIRSGIIENILASARAKSDQTLKKSDGHKSSRISGFAKLDDANQAGTRNGSQCTLILTEGDSAKTLAVSGLSVVGRDHYGVFPLRGKLLNVREASNQQIVNNVEISALKQIIGLQQGKKYESTKELRYGHIMIMTDQDHDGSHIKGLIINFLDHFWPSLLKIPGFLQEFITPIVKVTPLSAGSRKQELAFYTIPEYEEWKRENEDGKGFRIKYYKGLGTSTPEDAKKYFRDMTRHRKPFKAATDGDMALIDMAFNKKKADDRKDWLRQFEPGTFMDHSVDQISLTDFINRELILFSIADNQRSIPSSVDGMKPGQRKIMYCCFKRNLKNEIKVTQLAGYVSEHSAYHHGEQSLLSTIVGMAQNFVGSNNLPMLEPRGQFGTRLQGGKDSASPRYIFTMLNPLARIVFHPEDDALLKYLNDDGQDIEPQWYLPILPMILVNGTEGIGTGWSSSIPNYNPRDVIDNLYRLMEGEELQPMHPWYRGFTGPVEYIGDNKYRVTGTIRKTSDNTVEITELPVKMWTQTYKEMLEGWMMGDEDKKVQPWIKDYKEYHTDATVHFIVTLSDEQMKAAEAEGLEKKFKLVTTISTTNLVCFDLEGRIWKYATVEDLIKDFYRLRVQYYVKRKESMLNKLTIEWTRLDNKARFIMEIIQGKLVVQNRKKADIVRDLRARDYKPFPKAKGRAEKKGEEEDEEEDQGNTLGKKDESAQDYDYLLSMAIWSLTSEKVDQLKKELQAKMDEITILTEKTPTSLWRDDLDSFLMHWDAFEKYLGDLESKEVSKMKSSGVSTGVVVKKARKPAVKKVKDEDGDDDVIKKKPATKKVKDEDDDDDVVKKKSVDKKEAASSKPITSFFAPKEEKPAKAMVSKTEDAVKKKEAKPLTSYFDKEEKFTSVAPAVEDTGREEGEGKKRVLGSRKAVVPSKSGFTKVMPSAASTAMSISLDSDDDADFAASSASAAMKVAESKIKAVAAKKPTTKRVGDSDEDADEPEIADDDDDDDVVIVTKSKPRAATKRAVRKMAVDSDEEDAMVDDDVVEDAKSKPVKKPVKKLSVDTDEEDAIEMDKPVSKVVAKKPVKKMAVESDEDLNDHGDDVVPAKPKAAVAAKKPPAKKTVVDDYDFNEDDEPPKSKPKVQVAKKAAKKKVVDSDEDFNDEIVPVKSKAKAAPAAKKSVKKISKDSDEDAMEEDEIPVKKTVRPAAKSMEDDDSGKRRPARATKPVSYKVSAVDSEDDGGKDSDDGDDWRGDEDSDE